MSWLAKIRNFVLAAAVAVGVPVTFAGNNNAFAQIRDVKGGRFLDENFRQFDNRQAQVRVENSRRWEDELRRRVRVLEEKEKKFPGYVIRWMEDHPFLTVVAALVMLSAIIKGGTRD